MPHPRPAAVKAAPLARVTLREYRRRRPDPADRAGIRQENRLRQSLGDSGA
ncbi:hypothetical protein STRAU_3562 [Streptomyces aurantiacus JA 4570]|uniref:Uncharacterized protein n=1 Tax=Streptomyces aurantiacus JA 4570 TaxID=1286094 RepID=S3ZY67_9ACTN|nr:hypothetical protein STRAU_3562 [Streptomyces aurantiacus JA 4570]